MASSQSQCKCARFPATVRNAVLSLIVVAAPLIAVTPAVNAGNQLSIPLRWCALHGSPAVVNPMGAPRNPFTGDPEPDTDNVLWRRHERTTDNIWTPGAQITFRSGVTAEIRENASFPIIADPCPPSNVPLCQDGANAGRQCTPDGSGQDPAACGAGITCVVQACPALCPAGCPGQLGDILDPRAGNEEQRAITACRDAWAAITTASPLPAAPIAVNLRQFVDASGMPTADNLIGWGGFTEILPNPALQLQCNNPPTGITMALSGSLSVADNQILAPDAIDSILGHELGHVLSLEHGNGLDDETPPDGRFDGGQPGSCDPDEMMLQTPPNLMNPVVGSGVITNPLQRDRSRAVASVYAGLTIDPPGTLNPGPTISDERPDPPDDILDRALDIVWVTMLEDDSGETTLFAHGLFGLIPFESRRQYVVFADLDGNAATGGAPASLGFATRFQGAELVTRVVVERAIEIEQELTALFPTPTVWRFQQGTFVECTPAFDPSCSDVRAFVDAPPGGEDGQPRSHIVSIEVPNAVRGAVSDHVRIQAIAQQLPAGELDRLPDAPLDGAEIFRPVPPVFPECFVVPDPVDAGTIATVEASGLFENQTAKVILGDRMVAQGPIDAVGHASINFLVPIITPPGARLVTIGVAGTALTADCSVEVLDVGEPPVPATCDPDTPGAIIGTPGNDRIIGTPTDDVIIGLEGNDAIIGSGGKDCIDAGAGQDSIVAGDGDDRIIAGDGNDRILDRGGTNTITAGAGNDSVVGGPDDDRIIGGSGNDRTVGGDGDDEIDGGLDNDLVDGGNGTDTCANGESFVRCEVTDS